MIYSITVWALWIVETVFWGTVATVFGFFDTSGRIAHFCAMLWGKCIIYSGGIKVRITGLENIVKDKPQIFISNHQGFFDIFSISAFFPVQLRWVAKKELFRIPFVGWAMRAARYISIDRENKRSAIRSIEKSVKAIKKGFSVVIFPEGTRTLDGRMLPFKRGSLLLISRTDAPVVPVTICGSYKIIRPKELTVHRGTIHIRIDKPIYTDSMDKEEKQALLGRVEGIISENLDEMTGGKFEDK